MTKLTIVHNGKRYTRTDQSAQPVEQHKGEPALPWLISIKGDFGHTNATGVTRVSLTNTTEQTVMLVGRKGKYNPRDPHSFIWKPETYEDENGAIQSYVWCPACAEKLRKLEAKGERPKWTAWRKRDEFYTSPSRPNGLHSWCKECEDPGAAERVKRWRKNKRKNKKSVDVTVRKVDKLRKSA